MKAYKAPIIAAALAVLTTTGCVSTFSPVINNTDAAAVDFSQVGQMKTGKACEDYYLFLFGPFGTASLVEAAKAANISKVQLVDYRTEMNFLSGSRCIMVYGK